MLSGNIRVAGRVISVMPWLKQGPAQIPAASKVIVGSVRFDILRYYGKNMVGVQIFGLKNSQATRAAERFFKERRVVIQFVDLKQKAMARGEIKRFVDRFGLAGLLDAEGKAYVDAGLKYLKMGDAQLLEWIEREPSLLRLPLVRAGNRLSVGHDEASWKEMLAAAS
jgi:arsenate reductase-like glutaredoxin family protein